MTPAQQKTIEWLANGETGSSSETMAFWLAFSVKQSRCHYPLDPDDFDRCLRLLHAVPEMRPHLPRMAELNEVWAALVQRWEEIEASHLSEAGLGWAKGIRAPLTGKLIRRIIDPVEDRLFG